MVDLSFVAQLIRYKFWNMITTKLWDKFSNFLLNYFYYRTFNIMRIRGRVGPPIQYHTFSNIIASELLLFKALCKCKAYHAVTFGAQFYFKVSNFDI